MASTLESLKNVLASVFGGGGGLSGAAQIEAENTEKRLVESRSQVYRGGAALGSQGPMGQPRKDAFPLASDSGLDAWSRHLEIPLEDPVALTRQPGVNSGRMTITQGATFIDTRPMVSAQWDNYQRDQSWQKLENNDERWQRGLLISYSENVASDGRIGSNLCA
jgi:hypothetical protein